MTDLAITMLNTAITISTYLMLKSLRLKIVIRFAHLKEMIPTCVSVYYKVYVTRSDKVYVTRSDKIGLIVA